MNELDKFLLTPPNIGPPLPRILKAHWPWLKPSPGEDILPMVEAPKLVAEPQETETMAPSAPATLHRASEYDVETPPELLHELSPLKISPSWLQAQ